MRVTTTTTFLLLLVVSVNLSFCHSEEASSALTKIDMDNGSYYYLYVPDDYKPDGSWGAIVILHGAGGTAKGMISSYVHTGTNFLKDNKYIGIAVKSRGESWESGESTPMDALEEVLTKFKIDNKRVHILGYSAGGFFAGWLAFEKSDLFHTVIVVAASLANANMGDVKKNIQKPVYFVAGEKDPNLAYARNDYKNMLKMGAKYARLLEVKGQGHNNFPFHDHFPLFFRWYKAMESGYDYASAIEKAEKSVNSSYKKAMSIVEEVEKYPPEDEFWIRLAAVKAIINDKGEKKLKSTLMRLKNKKPEDIIDEMKKFEEMFKGYEVALKAAEVRKEAEAKIAGKEEEKKE